VPTFRRTGKKNAWQSVARNVKRTGETPKNEKRGGTWGGTLAKCGRSSSQKSTEAREHQKTRISEKEWAEQTSNKLKGNNATVRSEEKGDLKQTDVEAKKTVTKREEESLVEHF